jgi:hypothetical protein
LAPRLSKPLLPVRVAGDADNGVVQASAEAPRLRGRSSDSGSRVEISQPDGGTIIRVGAGVTAATLRREMTSVRDIEAYLAVRNAAPARGLICQPVDSVLWRPPRVTGIVIVFAGAPVLLAAALTKRLEAALQTGTDITLAEHPSNLSRRHVQRY